MYAFRDLFKKACIAGSSNGNSALKYYSSSGRPSLPLKHALIISKLSRYQFESLRYPELNEEQLKALLKKRGSDYDMVLKHHNLHKEFETSLEKALVKHGIETKVVNRFSFTKSNADWADVIFPTGGDGTFLYAASCIMGNKKPVIGLNSDPTRSEGHLCLPKKYSADIPAAIDKLRKGEFKWMFRSRIRITLCGEDIYEPPVVLHEREIKEMKYKFFDCIVERQKDDSEKNQPKPGIRILPVLALNEVFIGENLSARVSYFELRIDGSKATKVKSSGLCVCTGTGSTSWHLSINRLTNQSVEEVARLLGHQAADQKLIERVSKSFNDNLIFNPEEKKMNYTIRELISAGVWPNPKGIAPRGMGSKIEVRSRCFDAGLVVDGGMSFKFNDGTLAILEVNDADALRTVMLSE